MTLIKYTSHTYIVHIELYSHVNQIKYINQNRMLSASAGQTQVLGLMDNQTDPLTDLWKLFNLFNKV